MGNMRTIAFQVPEELFQKIKDYLQRNNMTQKQFVIGLIENEIERDLAQRQAMSEITENSERVIENVTKHKKAAAVSDSKAASEEAEEYAEKQDGGGFSYGSDNENEGLEESQDESENMGFSMGM